MNIPKINEPNIEIELNKPEINTNLDIKEPKIGLPGIDLYGGKIGGDINIPKVEIPNLNIKLDKFDVDNISDNGISGIIENKPLNIRTILSCKVDDPIIYKNYIKW